jgi:hypothetical protein
MLLNERTDEVPIIRPHGALTRTPRTTADASNAHSRRRGFDRGCGRRADGDAQHERRVHGDAGREDGGDAALLGAGSQE